MFSTLTFFAATIRAMSGLPRGCGPGGGRLHRAFGLALALIRAAVPALAQQDVPPAKPPPVVYVVPIAGTIDLGLVPFVSG